MVAGAPKVSLRLNARASDGLLLVFAIAPLAGRAFGDSAG
jgi:hypothetical protein